MNRETRPLLVACLCAEWCGSCRDYRPVFDALAADARPDTVFRWVDIEDEAELAGDIEVASFPTLLIARGGDVLFMGPVTPHAKTAAALIARARAGQLATTPDETAMRLARAIVGSTDR